MLDWSSYVSAEGRPSGFWIRLVCVCAGAQKRHDVAAIRDIYITNTFNYPLQFDDFANVSGL